MSDWQYGDVICLPMSNHPPTRVMFISRRQPAEWNTNGSVKFWGFQGVELLNDCPDEYPVCNMSHRRGCFGGYGGHPDDRHNSWTLET